MRIHLEYINIYIRISVFFFKLKKATINLVASVLLIAHILRVYAEGLSGKKKVEVAEESIAEGPRVQSFCADPRFAECNFLGAP